MRFLLCVNFAVALLATRIVVACMLFGSGCSLFDAPEMYSRGHARSIHTARSLRTKSLQRYRPKVTDKIVATES